jgi:flotillin
MSFSPPLIAVDEATLILATIMVILLTGMLLGVLNFAAKYYVRCPSNKILVIFGKTGAGRTATCVHGGARLVQPLIQDYKFLSLEPMRIEFSLPAIQSSENALVKVDGVLNVAIGTSPELMQTAAARLIDVSHDDIAKQAEDILRHQLRQAGASMQVEEMHRNRDELISNVQTTMVPELQKLGLDLIYLTITDITND